MEELKLAGTDSSFSRRDFLKTASTGARALIVSTWLPQLAGRADAASSSSLAPNAYVRVGADGMTTVVLSLVEMGQGTYTSIPMLIAEELDIGLDQLRVEHAPADEKRFGHPLYGLQITGGSASIQAGWAGLRQCGATARALLVAAASHRWKVSETQCTTERGRVLHAASSRSLGYGELVAAASALTLPKDVQLKDPKDFKLVGTRAHRLDTPSKVDGTAVYGIDTRIPGMKVATLATAPVIGGTLKSVSDARAKFVSGYVRTLKIDNAVAVVAEHYGAARKAMALLDIEWDAGPNRDFSNQLWSSQLETAMKSTGQVTTQEGEPGRVFAASTRHSAVYEAPPLAHTTLEPLNATVHVRQGRCDIWVGTQAQARAQQQVAQALGMKPGRVVVHNHMIGGGFGRKLDVDYIVLSALFARQVNHPLKVVFSREEDIHNDAFRPMFRHEMAAALDAEGRLAGFDHRLAGAAVITRYAPVWVRKGVDTDAVHTAELPYQVSARRVEFIRHEPPKGLMTGNWRGVGPTNNSYANECFIDELAFMAKADPVDYRLQMLLHQPRASAVLKLAAKQAGWGTPPTKGSGRGVAFVEAWGSFGALILDINVDTAGEVILTRAVCAIDCGLAVNPDGVESQMEGGIVYGLTAALYGRITFEGGRVMQTNFHDYPPLRMNQTPLIEVHLVKSHEAPGGAGEMGTALAAPALLNAIHAATGKRFRTFPVSAEQLRSA